MPGIIRQHIRSAAGGRIRVIFQDYAKLLERFVGLTPDQVQIGGLPGHVRGSGSCSTARSMHPPGGRYRPWY